MSRDSQDADKRPRNLLGVGYDGIYADAWGRQKVVNDYSVFHGLFTFDVPDKMWIEYFNDVEQVKTNATSVNGALKLISNGGASYLMSKRHPRYQPNRGMLFSNSAFIDNSTTTNGTLYAVVRTFIDGVVVEQRNAVSMPEDYNPGAGNIYDIQMQWRGVGDVTFYIGQKRVYKYKFLNALSELTTSNPALPIGFEAISDGTLRFGTFHEENGIFFEWVFNTPQETQVRCGCADITSEGGNIDRQQFVSIVGNEVVVTNDVVLAVRVADLFKGRMNTRDISLARVKATTDKKGDLKMYYTRDATALTINVGAWEPANGGNIEVFKPVLSTDSTLDPLKAGLVEVIPLTSTLNNVEDNPASDRIDFYLVHGDYLIFTGSGANAAIRAIVQFGEEL